MSDYVAFLGREWIACPCKLQPNPNRWFSATGYGSKIPSSWMVRFAGRWRRVYVCCYSNASTSYILHRGEKVVVQEISDSDELVVFQGGSYFKNQGDS